jgi:hypothetical protein
MVTNLFEDDGWLLLDRRNIPPPKEEKVSPASHSRAFQAYQPDMEYFIPVFILQLCPDFMESDPLQGNHKAICTRTRVYGC